MPKLPVSDWSIAHVLEWARKIVDEEEAQKLMVQKVDGKFLLLLTEEKLVKHPYNIAGGPAAGLAAAIEKLRAPKGTPLNYS